jgi:hypothetical protein
MSWGKIEDHLDDDPRWVGLDIAARGLWIACLPYALRADAPLVHRAIAHREAGDDTGRLTGLLVAAELWRVNTQGWEYASGGFAGWDAIAEPADLRAAIHERKSEAGKASAIARRAKYGSAIPTNAPNRLPNSTRSDNRTGTEQPPNTAEPGPVPGPGPGPVTQKGSVSGTAREAESHRADETTTAVDNSPLICPDCGKGNLRDRTNQQDGHAFIGCDRFPACKWVHPEHRRLSDLRRALSPPKLERLPDDPATVARFDAIAQRVSEGMRA